MSSEYIKPLEVAQGAAAARQEETSARNHLMWVDYGENKIASPFTTRKHEDDPPEKGERISGFILKYKKEICGQLLLTAHDEELHGIDDPEQLINSLHDCDVREIMVSTSVEAASETWNDSCYSILVVTHIIKEVWRRRIAHSPEQTRDGGHEAADVGDTPAAHGVLVVLLLQGARGSGGGRVGV